MEKLGLPTFTNLLEHGLVYILDKLTLLLLLDCLLNACHVESNHPLPFLLVGISTFRFISAYVVAAALVALAIFSPFDITFDSGLIAVSDLLSSLT